VDQAGQLYRCDFPFGKITAHVNSGCGLPHSSPHGITLRGLRMHPHADVLQCNAQQTL
jgi:hypothetical protein